jgi:hypothetical protein
MMTSLDDDRVISITVGRGLQWYGKMVSCIDNLSPADRAELEKWDSERPDGVATSDWPGFAKYLPPKPWECPKK